MKRYLYVMALSFGEGEPIGFKHAFVDALDEDEAYRLGFDAIEGRSTRNQNMNDYVVEVPRAS